MKKEKLIRKLYAGLCSHQELDQLFDLLLEEDVIENASIWAELWNQLGGRRTLDQSKSDRIYERVGEKIRADEVSLQKSTLKRRRLVLSAAAAMAILLVSVFLLKVPNIAEKQLSVYTTYGEKKQAVLPDGSAVTINANSELLYAADWDEDEERSVRLSGEAFFEVEKNLETAQKFKVITEEVIIEVFGTSFNVNAENEMTSIYLEEGQVSLSIPNGEVKKLAMSPGELVRYDHLRRKVEKVTDQARKHLSWKDGYIFFEKASLLEVCEELHRLYGIDYQLSDSLANELITTGLPIDNLDLALRVIEITKNLQLTRNGTKIFLANRKSEPPSN